MADDMEALAVSYEDLAAIEDDFDEVDVQIMRTQYELQKPLYLTRKDAISKIPKFWSLVFEQAPPEIDQYIQTEDSRIFADHLESIEVTRPELDSDSKQGNPRSLRIAFNFSANEDFEDTQLVKEFWWRRAKDDWTGLVSEPVRIKWKRSKDLSHGLTEMAWNLFDARKKTGDMRNKGLPEYTKLKKEVESWSTRNTSFFTWFGWVSDRRYVSAEESQQASEAFAQLKAKRRNGDAIEEANGEEEENFEAEFDDAVEATDDGEDLTLSLADELWPNAIKFFTQSQEEDMSDEDFEDLEEVSDDDDDGPVDIRSLVQKDSVAPPAKRQKK